MAPLERGRLIALIGKPSEEGKEGEKKERKGGEGETDEWGPGVSESWEKEKEREDAGRRGERDGGLLGR
jgi:hypothetical protein